MSKHTPEPWFEANGGSAIGAQREGLTFFCVCDNVGAENAARIAACVNALANIPDPAEFVEWAKRMKADRAALRAVVRECARADSDCCEAIRSLARSALANAAKVKP